MYTREKLLAQFSKATGLNLDDLYIVDATTMFYAMSTTSGIFIPDTIDVIRPNLYDLPKTSQDRFTEYMKKKDFTFDDARGHASRIINETKKRLQSGNFFETFNRYATTAALHEVVHGSYGIALMECATACIYTSGTELISLLNDQVRINITSFYPHDEEHPTAEQLERESDKNLVRLPVNIPFDKTMFIMGEVILYYERCAENRNLAYLTLYVPSETERSLLKAMSVELSLNSVGEIKECLSITRMVNTLRKCRFIRNILQYNLNAGYLMSVINESCRFNEGFKPFVSFKAGEEWANHLPTAADFDLGNMNHRLSPISSGMSVSMVYTSIISTMIASTLMLTCRSARTTSTTRYKMSGDRTYIPKSDEEKTPAKPTVHVHQERVIYYPSVGISEYDPELENEAADLASKSGKAVHIRRGHYKMYTPDRPLFGKVTGLVWFPPELIGRNKTNKRRSKETDYKMEV